MAEERLTDDPVESKTPELYEVEGEAYDEDLVGLTPGKLEEELERRRLIEARARAEREKVLSETRKKLEEGDFAGAEAVCSKLASEGDPEAETLLWCARTHGHSDIETLCDRRTALQFARAGEEARRAVLGQMGPSIEAEIARCEEAAAPLREKVYAGMEARRDAFRANRNYYLLRFGIVFGVFLALLIACIVSATFIVRRQGILVPVVTAVFGGLALAVFAVLLVYMRKLYVAQKLVGDNEKLSSTEDGTKLAVLEDRISLLTLARDGEEPGEDFSAYNALADDLPAEEGSTEEDVPDSTPKGGEG